MEYVIHPKHSLKILHKYKHLPPHRGLPPCRGGGAYAPMTRMII